MKKLPAMKMPSTKTDGKASHTRLKRPSHSGAPSAFPAAAMAFPTPPAAGGPGGPAPDTSMAPPPMAGSAAAPGDMGS